MGRQILGKTQEEWRRLYESDPTAFNFVRDGLMRKWINDNITDNKQRVRAHRILLRINQQINKYHTPSAQYVKLTELLFTNFDMFKQYVAGDCQPCADRIFSR